MNTQVNTHAVFVENPNVNYNINTFLQFKHSISRGQETYGYAISRLIDTNYLGKAYKAMGGGYDMHGTNLGNWLQNIIQSNELLLEAFTTDLVAYVKQNGDIPYGLYFDLEIKNSGELKGADNLWNLRKLKKAIKDKKWSLNGACGDSCMRNIAKIVGITVKDQYDMSNRRRGGRETFLGCQVTLDNHSSNTYRKLCKNNGVYLYV